MLNEKKILVMTKLARMEKRKERFALRDYYMGDYVRSRLIKTFFRMTFGYLLVLGMLLLYKTEYLIANAVALDYRRIAFWVLGIYAVLLAVYLAGTCIVGIVRYQKAKRFIGKYEKGLQLLRKWYHKEEERKRGGQAS